jgi:ATP-dependent protease ClpP protease subunit
MYSGLPESFGNELAKKPMELKIVARGPGMKRKRHSRHTGISGNGLPSPINTRRAIFLQGDIDENLFHSVAPEILRLKAQSSEPITIFIDSRGGDPAYARRILGLLRGPQRSDIVTVAIGYACSAAADLLTQGDYVVAYRNAYLLLHGTRQYLEQPITLQGAEQAAVVLESEDTKAAGQLALGVFRRFLRLYDRHSVEIADSRTQSTSPVMECQDLLRKSMIDVPALVYVLSAKVGRNAGRLLSTALQETRRIKSILNLYKEFVERRVDSAILGLVASRVKGEPKKERMQLRVLESVIASRLIGEDRWDLRRESFQQMEADFKQVLQLAEGYYQDDLLDLILENEKIFYGSKDLARLRRLRMMPWEKLEANRRAKVQFSAAIGRAYNRAELLWQYVTTLCRLLNEDENEFEPEEAWHIGLIDEVVGIPLAHRPISEKEKTRTASQLSLADQVKYIFATPGTSTDT